MGERILFFDVDGVLNVNCRQLDPRAIEQLKRLLRVTRARIVLSSDWRLWPKFKEQLRLQFIAQGLPEWVDETPVLARHESRPWEIWLWLRRNSADNWAAVDDMPLLRQSGGSFLAGRFVRTDATQGLTLDAADKLIAILKPQRSAVHKTKSWKTPAAADMSSPT